MQKNNKRNTQNNQVNRVVITPEDVDRAKERFVYLSIEGSNKGGVLTEVRPHGLKTRMTKNPEYIALGDPYYVAGSKSNVLNYLNEEYPENLKNNQKVVSDNSITLEVLNNRNGPIYDEFVDFRNNRKLHTGNNMQGSTKKSKEDQDKIIESNKRKLASLTSYLAEIKNSKPEKIVKSNEDSSQKKNLWLRIKKLQEESKGNVLNISKFNKVPGSAKSEKMGDVSSAHIRKVKLGDLPVVCSITNPSSVKKFLEQLALDAGPENPIDQAHYYRVYQNATKELKERKGALKKDTTTKKLVPNQPEISSKQDKPKQEQKQEQKQEKKQEQKQEKKQEQKQEQKQEKSPELVTKRNKPVEKSIPPNTTSKQPVLKSQPKRQVPKEEPVAKKASSRTTQRKTIHHAQSPN